MKLNRKGAKSEVDPEIIKGAGLLFANFSLIFARNKQSNSVGLLLLVSKKKDYSKTTL